MNNLLSILTGITLLSQVNHAIAQTGTSGQKGIEQLFSSVIRSSAVNEDPPAITSPGEGSHQLLLKASCEKIMKGGLRVAWLNDRNGKVKFQLRGVYTQGPAFYFLIRMNNRSAIDYEVESIRFFITGTPDKNHVLIRYGELLPLFIYDSSTSVRGYSKVTNVLVLPRFTLPRGRKLMIEVQERNGGRLLQVQATNYLLERAHII